MATRLSGLLLVLLGLSACAQNRIDSLPANVIWQLADFAGSAVVEGSRVTVEVDPAGTKLVGFTGCNYYTATLGGTFEMPRVGVIGLTKRACLSDELNAQERRFVELLRKASRIHTRGDEVLVVDTEAGALVFERLEKVDR